MSEARAPDAAPAPAAPAARVARPEWVGRALFEAALIVLSVVLGFAISEWRDRRAARGRAEQALVALRAEVDSNRAAVVRAKVKHRAFRDSLGVYAARGELPPERIYYGGMFSPAYVLSTAWQSARDGGALSELPYPLVVELAGVYERQSQYRALSDRLIESLYADMMRRGGVAVWRDGSPNFALLLRDFADREGTLEEMYDRTLRVLRGARPR